MPRYWIRVAAFLWSARVLAAIPLLVAGCGGGSSGPTAPTAAAPTVTAVAPVSGSLAGQTVVRITGSGFVATPRVTFDGVGATNVQLVDANSITASVPARATAGAVDLVVSNPSGGSGRLAGGYAYARYDGQWAGTSSQGQQVRFTVSADQVVTLFSAGYSYRFVLRRRGVRPLSANRRAHRRGARDARRIRWRRQRRRRHFDRVWRHAVGHNGIRTTRNQPARLRCVHADVDRDAIAMNRGRLWSTKVAHVQCPRN